MNCVPKKRERNSGCHGCKLRLINSLLQFFSGKFSPFCRDNSVCTIFPKLLVKKESWPLKMVGSCLWCDNNSLPHDPHSQYKQNKIKKILQRRRKKKWQILFCRFQLLWEVSLCLLHPIQMVHDSFFFFLLIKNYIFCFSSYNFFL
jgi:hypothetical protein